MFIFDSHKPSKHPDVAPYYTVWNGMRKRCTSIRLKAENPTYTDVHCCEEWKVFSSFRQWMETQDWQGKQLDKDILVVGNRMYGSSTTRFVSRQVNTALLLPKMGSGMPIGVSMEAGKYRAKMGNKHIGYYWTTESAHAAWQGARASHIESIAYGQIDLEIRKSLLDRVVQLRVDLRDGMQTLRL